MILQLTYISTAARGVDFADCSQILDTSRRNNTADGISGLLLFNGLRFLQALEGEPGRVSAAIARIRGDARHRSVVVLSERQVEAPEFGQWSMAFERAGNTAPADTLVQTVDSMVAALPSPNLKALFQSFVRLQRAA